MTETGPLPRFACGESGSTLRFLIPIALAAAGGGVFTGEGRLLFRPQGPYETLFREKGVDWSLRNGELTVRGRLEPGRWRLAGDVSSQFFTGLLFGLSRLRAPSVVESTTPLESAPYVAMTAQALARAGVSVTRSLDGRAFTVLPGRRRPFEAAVEGDWSQAAFWYAAAFLNGAAEPDDPRGGLRVTGLDPASEQGDRVILDAFRALARRGDVTLPLADCPDLLPPLAVMAAAREGVTYFTNAARLRYKESDRLATAAALLRAFHVRVEEAEDSLTVWGASGGLDGGPLRRGLNTLEPADGAEAVEISVDGAKDHRIVMAAAVAASASAVPVRIRGAEAVEKSYPAFWEDYRRLGGRADVV